MLQQYLPLAVLKLCSFSFSISGVDRYTVATVLTACGIETFKDNEDDVDDTTNTVATVLTACGIETTVQLIGLGVK